MRGAALVSEGSAACDKVPEKYQKGEAKYKQSTSRVQAEYKHFTQIGKILAENCHTVLILYGKREVQAAEFPISGRSLAGGNFFLAIWQSGNLKPVCVSGAPGKAIFCCHSSAPVGQFDASSISARDRNSPQQSVPKVFHSSLKTAKIS